MRVTDRATFLDRHDLRKVVAVLCASQITTWGVLFYAFPVLATSISRDEGWSLTTLVAVFTGAQVIAAGAGLIVGRTIDRQGPRLVMTAGSILGTASVLLIAWSPTFIAFTVGFALAGAAMSATLYPPAFAAVTHWAGERRVAALTAVTLVGGLASTVFAPLTAVLEAATDWRTTYAVLAVPLAATALLHWFGLGPAWRRHSVDGAASGEPRVKFRFRHDRVVRSRRYLALWVAMTLGGFSVYAVVVNLIPLLEESGMNTTTAAIALGIGGAGQVAGRLLYGRVLTPMSPPGRTALVLGAAGGTTALIAFVHQPTAVVFAICFACGIARGTFTLIQATAISDRWGTANYGARNSLLAGSTTAAAATAPWAGAAGAAALGSYDTAFLLLAVLAGVAAVCAYVEPLPAAESARHTHSHAA